MSVLLGFHDNFTRHSNEALNSAVAVLGTCRPNDYVLDQPYI
jgi:hypothetical protein